MLFLSFWWRSIILSQSSQLSQSAQMAQSAQFYFLITDLPYEPTKIRHSKTTELPKNQNTEQLLRPL